MMQSYLQSRIESGFLWDPPGLFKIVSSVSLAANKWKYRLQECGIDSLTGEIFIPNPIRFDTETERAFNLAELNNTATVASGLTVANIPGGFTLQPVANGTLVWATMRYDENGLICIFNLAGEFFGACP